MACVICYEVAHFIFDGFSLCRDHFQHMKRRDREFSGSIKDSIVRLEVRDLIERRENKK